MINIVGINDAIVNANHTLYQGHQVPLGDSAMFEAYIEAKPLVQFVTAHPLQIVAPGIENLLLQILTRILQRGRVARTQASGEAGP